MKKIIIAITIALLMLGCSEKAPNCSATETKKLVVQITIKELGKTLAEGLEIAVENIRTTNINEKVGSFECAADLTMTAGEGIKRSLPITYTSELSDEGDNFYVSVFGL